MERIRISELLAEHAARKGGAEVSKAELADTIIGDDDGRPQPGRSGPLSPSRRRTLVSDWDNGKSLTAFKPRHALRLARFFRISRITDIFEE